MSADTPEMVELFQKVARRVGDELRRPVVSYANGREIVITFGEQEPPSPLPAAVTVPASGVLGRDGCDYESYAS